MCLSFKHKPKEKFYIFQEGWDMYLIPKTHIQKHRMLSHKGDACASANLKRWDVIQCFVIKNEKNKIQQYRWIIPILKVYMRVMTTYLRVLKMRIMHLLQNFGSWTTYTKYIVIFYKIIKLCCFEKQVQI